MILLKSLNEWMHQSSLVRGRVVPPLKTEVRATLSSLCVATARAHLHF